MKKIHFLTTVFVILSILSVLEETEAAKVSQSNICSADELENKIQCFKEIPKSKYEIPEGSTVTMRCIVHNQHGKVQWRAERVLLGYDRNIPGRDRYRIVGSAVKGEHFLEIRNLKINDTGDYECQVQPVGGDHPLLRRKTVLTVLIRPSAPQILYGSIKPRNNHVIIKYSKTITHTKFDCTSYGGTATVKFSWFVNNIRVGKSASSSSNKIFNSKISQYKPTTKQLKPELSRLSLLMSEMKTGDLIRCRVANKATRFHHDPDQQFLETSVTVEVQTPTGPPKIVEITKPDGLVYTQGDVIKAKCVAIPAGQPKGSMFWRWQFPQLRKHFNDDYTYRDISTQNYNQRIENNQLISYIQLDPITRNYHGAKLVCIASNPVGTNKIVAKDILVKYPPERVTISTHDNSIGVHRSSDDNSVIESVIYGNSNEEKIITCTTGPYFNEAKINWRISAPTLSNNIGRHSSSNQALDQLIPTEKVWKEGDSYRRNSTITIRISKMLDRSFIDCLVWSGNKRVEARARFNVTYPPEKPIITGFSPSSAVKVNNIIELICSTVGGNPHPKLQWFRDNQRLKSTFIAERMGNQISLRIRITPSISDNNARYFCKASSIALKSGPLNSEFVQLRVQFPPNNIELISLSGSEVKNGDSLLLQCTAGESNPPAIVRWKIKRCGQMMAELGRRAAKKICDEEVISSTNEKVIEGKSGGSLLRSKLEIRSHWRDHLDYVDCEIYNPEYGEDLLVLRKRVQMNVTFPPQFEGITQNHFVIEQGQKSTYDLEPIANPPCQSYQWFKDNKNLANEVKNVKVKNAQFIVIKADPRDMGKYTLVASNSRGESKFNFFFNVTYGPKLIGDSFSKITNERDNIDLECSVNANPADPYSSFVWVKSIPSRGLNDISNSDWIDQFRIGCNQGNWKGKNVNQNFKYFAKCEKQSEFQMRSSLIIYDADRNDVGTYKCMVDNSIGTRVVKVFDVIRAFTPQILILPKFSKAATDQGKTLNLSCFIRAEPRPEITWYFGRYNSTIKQNTKYRTEIKRLRTGLYQAQLTILNLERTDHGRFICKAENSKGSDTTGIDVTGTSIPDVPMELRVINRTLNTMMISWTQGFDGGSLQTFRVRWKDKAGNSLYRYEDVASDETRTKLDFIIKGLSTETSYSISVNARNPQHGESAFTKEIIATTLPDITKIDTISIENPVKTGHNKLQNNTILFSVGAGVFAFVIIVVNVLLIVIVLRRRRQRNEAAKYHNRYGNSNNPKDLLSSSNGLILSREDHLRDSNSNFLRSDALELYPRGLSDTASSQIHLYHQHGVPPPNLSHHPHHSFRPSIPDDQKTFSSFETGSDDAREDLLRRQKDFGCCGADYGGHPTTIAMPNQVPSIGQLHSSQSLQGSSLILAYDPITNSSYYTTAPLLLSQQQSQSNTNPIYGSITGANTTNNDTMSTQLSANEHQFQQQPLMQLVNVVPMSNGTMAAFLPNSSSSNNNLQISSKKHPSSLSCGSVNSSNLNNTNNTNTSNNETNTTTNNNGQQPTLIGSNNVTNNTPYKSNMRVASPYATINTHSPQRDNYSNELRKAQLTNPMTLLQTNGQTTPVYTNSNIFINPATIVNRSHQSMSPQHSHILNPIIYNPHIQYYPHQSDSPIYNTQFQQQQLQHHSQPSTNPIYQYQQRTGSIRSQNTDQNTASLTRSVTSNQKYRCSDNQTNDNTNNNNNNNTNLDLVNTTTGMDSHLNKSETDKPEFLPRPDLI